MLAFLYFVHVLSFAVCYRQVSMDVQRETAKKQQEEEAWYRQQQLLTEAEEKRRNMIQHEEVKLADQRKR